MSRPEVSLIELPLGTDRFSMFKASFTVRKHEGYGLSQDRFSMKCSSSPRLCHRVEGTFLVSFSVFGSLYSMITPLIPSVCSTHYERCRKLLRNSRTTVAERGQPPSVCLMARTYQVRAIPKACIHSPFTVRDVFYVEPFPGNGMRS